MDCSVIIATFNRAHLLRQTLAALTTQELPADFQWEIVVVDNNSDDGTREAVEVFVRQGQVPIRYLFEARQGIAFARNTALSASEGEILAFTDDDVIPRRDWLPATLAAMKSRGLDGVGGKVLPRWDSPPPRWLLECQECIALLAMIDSDEPCEVTHPMTLRCRLVGANMTFRRALFQDCGYFNTALGHRGRRTYGNDEVELINRFLKAGKRIGYDPASAVYHRVGPERLTKRFFLKRRFYQALGDIAMNDTDATAAWRPERWRYRRIAELVVQALTHTALRRTDAFGLQLEVAKELGTLWGCIAHSRAR